MRQSEDERPKASFVLSSKMIYVLLIITLYFVYSPTFTFDYLMQDDISTIGKIRDPLLNFQVKFLKTGRPITGFFLAVVYNFVGYDLSRIQFVRFVGFVSVSLMALVLFLFLYRRSKSVSIAFFTCLVYFTCPSLQGFVAYSLTFISGYHAGMWLSLAAFYMHFYYFPKQKIPRWLGYFVVFCLWLAALHSMQSVSFFAMIPLSYFVLSKKTDDNRQILIFFILAIASLFFAAAIFKWVAFLAEQKGAGIHRGGRELLDALEHSPALVLLRAINPKAYWSAFKVLSFPYPFHRTIFSIQTIATITMLLWAGVLALTFFVEIYKTKWDERQRVMSKWFFFLLCLAFSAVMMVADSPLHIANQRPHITLTLTGVCIFSTAYCCRVLWERMPLIRMPIIKLFGGTFILFTLFGAQSQLMVGTVNLRENEINFIRTELSKKPSADFDTVIVVLPGERTCTTAPCDSWAAGWPISAGSHPTKVARYHYVLHSLGIPPDSKKLIFVEETPEQTKANEIVLNWKQYAAASAVHRGA